MEYTTNYNSATSTLTFTSTDTPVDLSLYTVVLFQEGAPGTGYSEVKRVVGSLSVSIQIAGDGVHRFKLGSIELSYEDVDTGEVDINGDPIFETIETATSSLAISPYFHKEDSRSKRLVVRTLMSYVISKTKRPEKLMLLSAVKQLLHQSDISYTLHNYIEADTILRKLSTLQPLTPQ